MTKLQMALGESSWRDATLRVGTCLLLVGYDRLLDKYSASVSRDNPSQPLGFDLEHLEFVDSAGDALKMLRIWGYDVTADDEWKPLLRKEKQVSA
jgi:hypothetical protein